MTDMQLESPSLKEIASALCRAQAVMRGAVKDATNPHFKSRYADLASVIEAIREPLTSHGLSWVQRTLREGDNMVLETRLLHVSGEWMASHYPIKPVKADPQGIGSALTYARRYSLMALAGIAADDDDDGEAAVGRSRHHRATHAPIKAAPVADDDDDGEAAVGRSRHHRATHAPITAAPVVDEGHSEELATALAAIICCNTRDELKIVWHRHCRDLAPNEQAIAEKAAIEQQAVVGSATARVRQAMQTAKAAGEARADVEEPQEVEG